jgi:hypothetical protein
MNFWERAMVYLYTNPINSLKNVFLLHAFDAQTLEQKPDITLSIPDFDGMKSDMETMRMLGDKIFFFSDYKPSKNGVRHLCASPYSYGQNDPVSMKLLLDIEEGFEYSIKADEEAKRIIIVKSRDFNTSKKLDLEFHVFDESLTEKAVIKTSFENQSAKLKLENFKIWNNDEVFFVIGTYPDSALHTGLLKNRTVLPDANKEASFKLYRQKKEGSGATEIPVKLKDGKNLQTVNFDLLGQNDLWICSMFSPSASNAIQEGLYISKRNSETGEILFETYTNFDAALIAQLKQFNDQVDKSEKRRVGESLGNFNVLSLNNASDGGMLISGEFFKDFRYAMVTASDGGGVSTDFTNFFCAFNMFSVKLNSTGKVEWSTNFPRVQKFAEYPMFVGSSVYTSGNRTFFLFNDSQKNYIPLRKTEDFDTWDNNVKSTLVVAELSNDGKWSFNALEDFPKSRFRSDLTLDINSDKTPHFFAGSLQIMKSYLFRMEIK